jgi:type I restriction-modification system DNA methylase subunit
MTPAEAVDLMVNMALFDLENEDKEKRIQDFLICDPCCGVGSFLSAFYKKNKQNNVIDTSKVKIIGQDKVTRMVRLAKINMMLFNNHNHLITCGNSLSGESAIDKYKGKIDLILTNPPFGARFTSDELKANAKNNYPFLHDLILKNGSNFNSETLFLDRCISLLKPNGRLLAVLPDSVISSAGLNSTLRHRLIHSSGITIRAIMELPSVTFAQAGTRTKTSILYLQKTGNSGKNKNVFIAQSEQIGFEVSTKKGSTVKVEVGENDLLKIFEGYRNSNNYHLNGHDQRVVMDSPSCVIIKPETLERKSWTPSHYNSRKIEAVRKLGGTGKEIELVKLIDIVDFITGERKKEFIPNNSSCISVLHILNDDNLNYEELLVYKPKFPGTVCKSGDLLFSKINPRILRVLVVPDLGLDLTCSSEFEIINSITEISNYAIKLLLMSPSVQTQINCLTSGTSSSHNRIKSADLANVLIPMPMKKTALYKQLLDQAAEYEQKNKRLNKLRLEMSGIKKSVFELVS